MNSDDKDSKNPYLPEKFKILKIFDETADIKTFRIAMASDSNPGKFVEMSVPGIGECPIGICSYSNDYTELCIRNVGNTTKAIHSAKEGDCLWIRGPYGNGYPMDKMKGKDIILIAGGTGTAPIRSVIEYIKNNRNDFGKVTIFAGFRHYEDVLFKRDSDSWKEMSDFQLTLDCPPENKNIKCNVGVVTALIDKAELNKEAIALMCGPPVMMKFAVQSLMNKGLKEENVYISFERLMSCGIGKCGHCEVGGRYVCKHGPVFRYDNSKKMID